MEKDDMQQYTNIIEKAINMFFSYKIKKFMMYTPDDSKEKFLVGICEESSDIKNSRYRDKISCRIGRCMENILYISKDSILEEATAYDLLTNLDGIVKEQDIVMSTFSDTIFSSTPSLEQIYSLMKVFKKK